MKEAIGPLIENPQALGLLLLAFLAFTTRQKQWIRERDNNRCQAFWKHKCGGGLQVHHIIPQRYAKRMGIEDPDYAENGITLCANAHCGNPNDSNDCIHPDMVQAKRDYRKGNKQSYDQTFNGREHYLDNRQPYWNTKFDRKLHVIAVRNTQKFLKEKDWPGRRKRGS